MTGRCKPGKVSRTVSRTPLTLDLTVVRTTSVVVPPPMLSNLQILSQFATALHIMSFSMMALGIGQSLFPRAEVDGLSPAPRAARAASYMSAMGLWRPQTGVGDPRPVQFRYAARV